jgi:hypothetical protein
VLISALDRMVADALESVSRLEVPDLPDGVHSGEIGLIEASSMASRTCLMIFGWSVALP